MRHGGRPSIPPSATVLAAITIAAALSEANTRPPSSVGVDVTATAVTTAANVANDARYNPAFNVNGGPSPAALDNDADNGRAENTLVQAVVVSVILNAAKSSLWYFEGVRWSLNKALSKGAEFLNGPLEDIARQFLLVKMQVACQLLNNKKDKFMNMQVSIVLNPSDLDERIREGVAMSAPKFASSTLLRICDPDPSSYVSDFSNLCVVMKSLTSTACTHVRLIADSPADACFCFFVDVDENWIQNMAETIPRTAAGVPNAQLNFERAKEMKMRAFVADFMKEYESIGLPPADISCITFGRLGAFLHLALFQAWSNAICDNKKPPIEFPVDCLIGMYALPVLDIL
jgi:hypothetical protein